MFHPGKFPVDITEIHDKRQSDAKRTTALESAGLAAFPGIKKTLDSKEPELRKMDLILSDDGWVPQSMVHGPARNM